MKKLGTNQLLKMLQGCKDVNLLNDLLDDPTTPRQVQKRAAYKLDMLMAEKKKRGETVVKAQETRQRNKIIRLRVEAEL
jgi:hypothetical protein